MRPFTQVMIERRRLVLIGGFLVIGLGAAYFFYSQREPVDQGKTWSAWFKALDHSPPCSAEKQVFLGDQLQAVEALRRIGPQAMPLIVSELRAKDWPLKLRLLRWARQHSFTNFEFTPASERRDKAMVVCALLGPKSEPALSELTRLLDHSDAVVRASAVCTIGNIRTVAGIPALLKTSRDTNVLVRCFAMLALGTLGNMSAKPDAVIPTLIEGMQDTNAAVRLKALVALENFAGATAAALPPLLKALEDPETHIRPYAARALGKCSGQTNLVVPALLKAVRDADPHLRLQATVALSQFGIDLIQVPAATPPAVPKGAP